MIDSYQFENELFKNVSQHSSTLITCPHLEQLDITLAYVEQFLFEKKYSFTSFAETSHWL